LIYFIGDFIMARVYAVVYSSATKQCLVFKKNMKAYFYGLGKVDESNQSAFEAYPSGVDVANGPGSYCFPGGGLEKSDFEASGDTAKAGAIREFREETGFNLDGVIMKSEPLVSREFTDCIKGRTVKYRAVFFDADTDTFKHVIGQCQANLNTKKGMLTDTPNDESIAKYIQETYEAKNPFMQDDELASVKQATLIVRGNDVIGEGEVYFTKGNIATGWFYNIVAGNASIFS
jgi:ADP-ribose pyrophosphatase YjhB (NUDIX family)